MDSGTILMRKSIGGKEWMAQWGFRGFWYSLKIRKSTGGEERTSQRGLHGFWYSFNKETVGWKECGGWKVLAGNLEAGLLWQEFESRNQKKA